MLAKKANRAGWVQENFITADTEKMSADAQSDLAAAVTELAVGAKRFESLSLPPDETRKLKLLKLQLAAPAPSDAKEREELTTIGAWLNGEYGRGKYCRKGEEDCLDIDRASAILATSRDPKELLDVWQGWHRVGVPMRERYQRFVELSNKGSRELGFADTGVMWRSNYDLPPDQFSAELERLWTEVQPLYQSLHTYVRTKLAARYGPSVMPANGMIPAHLLGNMWAQQWGNIYPLVAAPASGERYDLTAILKARKTDERTMVRVRGTFLYVSGLSRVARHVLGAVTLPEACGSRSGVSCERVGFRRAARRAHQDVRADYRRRFRVVHHELGHNYYTMLYGQQPFLSVPGPLMRSTKRSETYWPCRRRQVT